MKAFFLATLCFIGISLGDAASAQTYVFQGEAKITKINSSCNAQTLNQKHIFTFSRIAGRPDNFGLFRIDLPKQLIEGRSIVPKGTSRFASAGRFDQIFVNDFGRSTASGSYKFPLRPTITASTTKISVKASFKYDTSGCEITLSGTAQKRK